MCCMTIHRLCAQHTALIWVDWMNFMVATFSEITKGNAETTLTEPARNVNEFTNVFLIC